MIVQVNRPVENGGVGTKTALPEIVTQNDDRLGVRRLVVGRGKLAAESGVDSEKVEVVAGDEFGGDGFRRGIGQHGDLVPAVESQKAIERDVGGGLKVAKEGVRKGTGGAGKLGASFGNGDD